MKKIIFLLLFLAFGAIEAKGQGTQVVTVTADPATCNTGMLYYNSTSNTLKSCGPNNTWSSAGAISSVSSLPATCTPGVTAPVQLSVAPYGIYYCSATNTWSTSGATFNGGTIIDPTQSIYAGGIAANDYAKICVFPNVIVTSGSPNITCYSSSPTINPVASVTGNVATLNLQNNPLTIGAVAWGSGNTIVVSGFSGGDTYFNGTFTLSSATSSSITFPLVHANASASSQGVVQNQSVGPFSTANDVGKDYFATNFTGLNGDYPTVNLISGPQGTRTTILSVTNSTTFVGSSNASFSNTTASNGYLTWGNRKKAALAAAYVAATTGYSGGHMQMPAGYILVEDCPFTSTSTNPGGVGNSVTTSKYASVEGWSNTGLITVLIPTPDFGFTLGGGGNYCFAGAQGVAHANYAVWAMGNQYSGTHNGTLFLEGTDATLQNLSVGGMGLNVTGLVGFTFGSAGAHSIQNIIVDGVGASGSTACSVASTTTVARDVFCGDSIGTPIVFSGTGTYRFDNLAIQVSASSAAGACTQVTAAGTVNLNRYTCAILKSGGTQGLVMTAGNLYLDDFNIVNNGNTANTAISLSSGTPSVHMRRSTGMRGGATAEALFAGASTVQFFDEGSNIYTAGPFFGGSAGTFIPLKSVTGACTGVGTAASTLGLFGTGPNVTLTTCTSTTVGSGIVMDHTGQLQILQVTATAAGTNASSGVVTVLKNGAGTTITCTVGTSTSCIDGTHSVSFVAGDLISINFTTQAADTLAGVKAIVQVN